MITPRRPKPPFSYSIRPHFDRGSPIPIDTTCHTCSALPRRRKARASASSRTTFRATRAVKPRLWLYHLFEQRGYRTLPRYRAQAVRFEGGQDGKDHPEHEHQHEHRYIQPHLDGTTLVVVQVCEIRQGWKIFGTLSSSFSSPYFSCSSPRIPVIFVLPPLLYVEEMHQS